MPDFNLIVQLESLSTKWNNIRGQLSRFDEILTEYLVIMTSSLYVLLSLVLVVSPSLADSDDSSKWHPHGRSPYIIRDYASHSCRRPCDGSTPRVCRYYFLVEHYKTMSRACAGCPGNATGCQSPMCVTGDGRTREILTVNRMMPGPTIDVCQHDTIEVVVDNKMSLGEGLSIHWHGLRQVGTPHMDGTSMVTQCPIPSGGKMTYRFAASQPGTFFWHSHSSLQRADGLFGGLVIRQPPSADPHAHLYDVDSPDHWLVLNDWPKAPISQLLVDEFMDELRTKPTSILINGLGSHDDGPLMPKKVFTVEKGNRYRFRVILSGIINCPIYISIDEHPILVVASDGEDVEPIEVDRFMIFAGERWDFILNANHTEAKQYWIRFKARGRGLETLLIKTAVLKYKGSADKGPDGVVEYRTTKDDGRVLNGHHSPSPDDASENTKNIQVVDLKSKIKTPDEGLLTEVPDKQFYISLGPSELFDRRFKLRDNDRKVRPINPQLNYITSILPTSPPLTQFHDIPQSSYCNNQTVGVDCSREVCECVHRLQYRRGDLVELVLVNFEHQAPAHPMHMHGHAYTVVAMKPFGRDVTVDEVKAADARGEIPRTQSPHAVRKDTLVVKTQSVAVVRFRADNPGFWLFHCHVELHAHVGMLLILQEGELEDMPPAPSGVTRCGNSDFSDLDHKTLVELPGPDIADSSHKVSSISTVVLLVAGCVTVSAFLGFVLYRKQSKKIVFAHNPINDADYGSI